jgi:Protein of unknown function (DUF3443)
MRDLRKFLIAVTGLACAFSAGCGGGSSTATKSTAVTPPSGQNVAAITVNTGPGASQGASYANGPFASVTLCVPGSSTCQTIDGVLVDTGSSGLRILSSALAIALPQQKAGSGNPVAECLTFLGSYTWGPVQTSDVQMAGEKANSTPIQVLSDTDFKAPSGCTSSGMPSADTLTTLGANGILGVGPYAQDCGNAPACVTTGAAGLYYECPSSGCIPTGEPLAKQVINPVALFPSDNNGVIIELPAVPVPAATVSGSLVFGIGTQSNNGLGGASVYTMDPSRFSFTVKYNTTPYQGSFIDSGSNGYFFLDSSTAGVPVCTSSSGAAGFYCPPSTKNFSATNEGLNGTSGTVNFSIANAASLFSNSADAAFSQLGGPSTNSPSASNPDVFDWGLPFFYGRNVYTAIEGTSAPGGATPYWAY